MLTRDQIEALRPLVEKEPQDSPAHLLLAHIDEVEAAKRALGREHSIAYLKGDGHSDESIEKILAALERGVKLEDESFTCPDCEGSGVFREDFLKRCPRCYHGKITRLKAPNEPAIEVSDPEGLARR